MTDDVITLLGVPVLGAVLLAGGLWSRRDLGALVGDRGTPELLEHRRAVLGRGSLALMVAGTILLLGGVGLSVVVGLRK